MNEKRAKILRRMARDAIALHDHLRADDFKTVYSILKKDKKAHAIAQELQRQMRLRKKGQR